MNNRAINVAPIKGSNVQFTMIRFSKLFEIQSFLFNKFNPVIVNENDVMV